MSRLPLDTLEALVASEFPDNTAAFITPTRLRTIVLDMITSLQPTHTAN